MCGDRATLQKTNNAQKPNKTMEENVRNSKRLRVMVSFGQLKPLPQAVKMVNENTVSEGVAAQACGLSRNQVCKAKVAEKDWDAWRT